MRITNRMITTQYIRSLNNLTAELNKARTQVESGRKFSRSSENTSAAIKAFQIRKDLIRSEGYKENLAHAKSTLTDAESALTHMEELMRTAFEKVGLALNDTHSEADRTIYATELRNIQEQLFQTLNSVSSDSYYFGGTNTSARPFELVDGKLQYNGFPLDVPLPGDTSVANEVLFKKLEKDSMALDIGLNVKIDVLTGKVDDSTVFSYTIPGINIVGRGTVTVGGEEISGNLYDLLGALAAEFESDDYNHNRADSLFGHLKNVSANIGGSITEIGAKTSYLEFMSERIEDKIFNLDEKQVNVEGIDPAAAIIQFEAQKFAYTAALRMGAELMQPTIFDYMS